MVAISPTASVFAVHACNKEYRLRNDKPSLRDSAYWGQMIALIGLLFILMLIFTEGIAAHVLRIMSVTLVCLILWRSRRFHRLEVKGQVFKGKITRARMIDVGGKSRLRQLIVDYRFTSPDGKQIVGKTKVHRDDLEGKPLPTEGTPIRVLYLNDHYHQAV